MADRFFPAYVPDEELLRRLCLIRYYPKKIQDSDFFHVSVMNVELKQPTHPKIIQLPNVYFEHLRRFIWRQHVFMELAARKPKIPDQLRTMIKKYIMYMDGMIEGLLTTARQRKGELDYRSRLFNQYLIVEYFVGRHEYDVVGRWRMENADTILECQDMEALGMYISVRSITLLTLRANQ